MKRSCVGLVLFLVLTLWTCASDIAALDLVSPPPGDILLPRDHRVVLYLDCGAGEDTVIIDFVATDAGKRDLEAVTRPEAGCEIVIERSALAACCRPRLTGIEGGALAGEEKGQKHC